MRHSLPLVLAASLLPGLAFAQTTPAPAPAPTSTTTTAPADAPTTVGAAPTAAAAADTAKEEIKPEFFGYVGVYYGYDFNNPASLTRPGFIYSENLHNQIAVNLALLGARFTGKRIRGTFAIQTGTYPDANYAAEPQIFKNIYEAWAGVKVANNLWLDAGIFVSHIGLEGPNSRDNLTLTRSIMADNSPYYEAGAKLTYDKGKKWLFSVLAINGWQVIRDRNQNEAIGTQIQFRPTPKVLLNSSTFIGEGRNVPDSVGVRLRYFHNFYVTYDPNKKWKIAGAFDTGWQEKLDGNGGYDAWQGGSLIVRRRLWERAGLVGRAEFYHDPSGVLAATRFGGLRTTGYSLGFDYLPVPRIILRAEVKEFIDKNQVYQKEKSFVRTNGVATLMMGLTL
jgi:hypothetical protein